MTFPTPSPSPVPTNGWIRYATVLIAALALFGSMGGISFKAGYWVGQSDAEAACLYEKFYSGPNERLMP